MKKTLLLLTIFLLAFILSGCGTEVANPLADNSISGEVATNDQTSSTGDAITSVDAVISTPIASSTTSSKKTVQKFYPEGLSPKKEAVDDSKTSAGSGSSSFSVNQELQVKLYLIDKYNPGVCYGLPGPVPEVAIQGMITDNPDLVKFLKSKYELKTDLDIYKKIKQINGIYLKQDKGSYLYEFTDGQCCTLHAYQGQITIIGNNISDTILQQETQSNPC
ncbi:MAG: hypothetical protein WC244_00645 [Patescibacteria group bacterium]|jgi:hypothetical protein